MHFLQQKLIKNVRQNWVVRFLASHLLILLVVLLICLFGFQSAFAIIQQDILESAQFSLQQSVVAVDSTLTELRTLGLQTARSESLRALARTTMDSNNYYSIVRHTIDEYYERMQYYSPTWAFNSYIYMNDLDHIIYRDTLYRPAIFAQYLKSWGTSEEEAQALWHDEHVQPYFSLASDGDIYYIIPCTGTLGAGGRFGSVLFRMDSDSLMKKLSLLENLKEYCLAIYDDDGNRLFVHDDLGVAKEITSKWYEKNVISMSSTNLVISMSGDSYIGWHYVLIVPQHQAMQKLIDWRNRTFLLILFAGMMATLVSLYYSIRSGKPVNEIATALSTADSSASHSLEHISGAVARLLQENRNLIAEQEHELPALQKTFFHNLLKWDFVSGAELEYMAKRAKIELTGTTCIFRLHPATCTVFFCHLAEQNPPPCRGCLPLHRWCKGSARSLRSGKALASKVQLVNQSS
jgi:hypothetical protein